MENSRKNTVVYFFLSKVNRSLVATLIVLVFFLISLSGIIFPPINEWSSQIANRNYNGEGLIELIEAACWLFACVIYLFLFFSEVKERKWSFFAFWFIFFGIFSFVAFGEEISWGQHLFGLETSETVKYYNWQEEINIHNLNISKILGISEENPIFRYLRNFNNILNPLFYLLCGIFWFVIPLLKRAGKLTKYKIIAAMPSPAFGTVVFCGANIFAFLIIDKLFFDIGEIFELSWALVALMVSLDVLWPQGSFKSLG